MTIKRIMLIQPPGNYLIKTSGEKGGKLAVHPIGIAYIASYLESKGFEVSILDALVEGYDTEVKVRSNSSGDIIRYGLNDEEISAKIKEFNPDLVGVSCLQSTRSIEAHNICKLTKELLPQTVVIMGGGHPTVLPELTLDDLNVDYVILGEGEETVYELITVINAGKNVSDINGVAYRHSGKNIIKKKKQWIKNLDSLPIPAWHLLPMQKYIDIGMSPGRALKNKNWVTMYTSRGCPGNCSYCPASYVWGPRFRYRSPESVVEEMEYLIKNYNIQEFQFEDSNMTVDKERIIKFTSLIIEKNMNISWSAPHGTAINTLDNEILSNMYESGCYVLYLAIESSSQETLETVEKDLNVHQIQPIIDLCKEIGFKLIGYFMIGFPEETPKEIDNTIRFAESLDLDGVCFFIATPLPGTNFYNMCAENDYLIDEFTFDNARYGAANLKTAHFHPKDIEKIRRDAWLKIMAKKTDTHSYDKSQGGYKVED